MHLRPLTVDDAETYAGWSADPDFCRAAGWTVGLPLAEHVSFWRDLIASPPPELLRLGAVHEGELVAYVDLHGMEPRRRELGFAVGRRERWGRGLGSRAAAAALDHGFEVLGLEEVWAEALDANRASVRILQSLGMRETGRGEDDEYCGTASFHRKFAITAKERPPRWRRDRLEEGPGRSGTP